MKYDCIVWDYNGTILDDLQICYDVLIELMNKRHLKPVTMEEYKEVFTFPVINYYKAVGFDVEHEDFQKISEEFFAAYESRFTQAGFCKNAIKTLDAIKEKGIEQLIISASEINKLKNQCDELGIRKYFSHCLGISTIQASSKVAIAIKFVNKYAKNKKILFIGDTLHDAEVADTVGADIILVAQGHQSKKRLEASGHKVVDTVDEVLKELD